MLPAGAFDSVEIPLEKLWRFDVVSIMTGQIPFQTEIEACDFTRHGSIQVWIFMVSCDANIDITNGIPLDSATFRVTNYLAGFEVSVDSFTDTDLVAFKQFPTRLKQCKRFVFAMRLETRSPPSLASSTGFKHCLVAFVKA